MYMCLHPLQYSLSLPLRYLTTSPTTPTCLRDSRMWCCWISVSRWEFFFCVVSSLSLRTRVCSLSSMRLRSWGPVITVADRTSWWGKEGREGDGASHRWVVTMATSYTVYVICYHGNKSILDRLAHHNVLNYKNIAQYYILGHNWRYTIAPDPSVEEGEGLAHETNHSGLVHFVAF